jgi:large subunit ribosomal protein L21
MWAVVEIGKKQYKVEKGSYLAVDRLKQEGEVTLDKVLLLQKNKKLQIGKPYLKGVKVKAQVIEEKKDKKVIVYKAKRRKKYRRTHGHRQIITLLKVSDIVNS